MKAKLQNINNNPKIMYRYCDDVRNLVRSIKRGWRWRKGKMMYKRKWEEEDLKQQLTPDQMTKRTLKDIMESVFKEFKFEMETQEDHESNTLPTLDYQTFMAEDGKTVLYFYFEKSVGKKFVINKESALGEGVKVSTLSQEVVRRMKTTSRLLDTSVRVNIINTFTRKLERSGYQAKQIREIISAGLCGYEKIVKKAERTGGNINRGASEGAGRRHLKRLLGRQNWFRVDKKKGDENEEEKEKKEGKKKKLQETQKEHPIVSILFLPKTEKSGLKKKMQYLEKTLSNVTKSTIRYVEVSGTQIINLLHTSEKWGGTACHRGERCLSCSTPGERKQPCEALSQCYITWCLFCEERQKLEQDEKRKEKEKSQGDEKEEEEAKNEEEEDDIVTYLYCGQTAGGMRRRGELHDRDYRKGVPDSHMHEHAQTHHPGEHPKFGMKSIRRCKSALHRLVFEACKIRQFSQKKNIVLLNNKYEMSSVIPVLSVLKNSDEGLPTAPSLETKIPETSGEDPKVVSETIPSFKSKGKVKFKQKDDVYHKDTAAATPKNNKTKITQYFSASK